ncbi:MAG: FMN-binding glutamate synthase family protein [Hyphomicrobiales bacterium]|nr:FMN-binding glutamate synthase family protein [Hyphomicrobiales bacterium]
MRTVFYIVSVAAVVLVALIGLAWPSFWWALIIVVPFILVGIYDIHWATHNVLRNYPVIGHLRYGFEFISPEIRQYFVENNEDGKPFNRLQRELIYARAAGTVDTQPFGTQMDIMDVGFIRASHSLSPKKVSQDEARITVGGPECKQPYNASRLNISAMSFGALSPTAVHALNAGAKLGNFAHNTGEGGLSPYHLAGGGDIMFQIGTGYFGCRTLDGEFDEGKFIEIANHDVVRMIEIKLSQGAKPAHGGVLPAAKVDEEIARIRGVPMGKDVISPPAHTTFSTPEGLLEWVTRLREISGGKPIGFKLCIGRRREFMGIIKAMLKTKILPDFITIDGAEGGTGAAPPEFTDRLGIPVNEGLAFAHSCLVGASLRNDIRLIASGKVVTGFHMVEKIALGADMCNMARPMLFALGCIQAVRCNTNSCPTGITTQDRRRAEAVDVDLRQKRVAQYHKATVESFLDLVGAMGLTSPTELTPDLIYRRVADETERPYDEIHEYLRPGALLKDKINPVYAPHWKKASAEAF